MTLVRVTEVLTMLLTAMRLTIICRAGDQDVNVPYGLLASDVRGQSTEDDVLNIVPVDEPPVTAHYIDEQLGVNSMCCMVGQGGLKPRTYDQSIRTYLLDILKDLRSLLARDTSIDICRVKMVNTGVGRDTLDTNPDSTSDQAPAPHSIALHSSRWTDPQESHSHTCTTYMQFVGL